MAAPLSGENFTFEFREVMLTSLTNNAKLENTNKTQA